MAPVLEAVVVLGAVGMPRKSDCVMVAVALPMAVVADIAVVMPALAVHIGVVPVRRVRVRAEAVRPRDSRCSAGEEGSSEQSCHPCTRAETRENG
jgi:hypothetical protein